MKMLTMAAMFALISLLPACDQNPPPQTPAASGATELQELKSKADSGDVPAELALAKRYDEGNGVERDQAKAYALFLKAAEKGSVEAMMEVIDRLEDHRAVQANSEERQKWIQKAAAAGNARAQLLRADEIAWTSRDRVVIFGSTKEEREKKLGEWRDWLEKSAAQGNAVAKYELGFGYLVGTTDLLFSQESIPSYVSAPDPEKGMSLILDAANAGEWHAQLALAIVHQVGYASIKQDQAKSNAWWDRLDQQSDPKVQFEIGNYYDESEQKYYVGGRNKWRGSSLNFYETNARAIEWYKRANAANYAPAALKLAAMYKSGRGTYNSEVEAFALLIKAADAGLTQARYQVGLAYVNGAGTTKDYAKAIQYFLSAASGLDAPEVTADAKNALGVMNEYGWGTEKDQIQAYAWYNLAAASDNAKAKENLARVEKEMNAKSIAEAQALSSQWKPGVLMSELQKRSADGKTETARQTGKAIASGTGIAITTVGHLLTNNHVVVACNEIRLPAMDRPAKLLIADAANDLALLKAEGPFPAVAKFAEKDDLKQGEEVVAFGFPLEGFLPAAGNVTLGVVSALAGPGNNASLLQITAPVQPGNSGGAVLDRKGRVVGIVVGKVDAIKVALVTGDIPQNINFAISGRTVKSFLDGNQIKYETAGTFLMFDMTADKLADEARAYSIKIECRK